MIGDSSPRVSPAQSSSRTRYSSPRPTGEHAEQNGLTHDVPRPASGSQSVRGSIGVPISVPVFRVRRHGGPSPTRGSPPRESPGFGGFVVPPSSSPRDSEQFIFPRGRKWAMPSRMLHAEQPEGLFLKWEGEAPAEPRTPERPARLEPRPPESPLTEQTLTGQLTLVCGIALRARNLPRRRVRRMGHCIVGAQPSPAASPLFRERTGRTPRRGPCASQGSRVK
jgi:hypothetical protein